MKTILCALFMLSAATNAAALTVTFDAYDGTWFNYQEGPNRDPIYPRAEWEIDGALFSMEWNRVESGALRQQDSATIRVRLPDDAAFRIVCLDFWADVFPDSGFVKPYMGYELSREPQTISPFGDEVRTAFSLATSYLPVYLDNIVIERMGEMNRMPEPTHEVPEPASLLLLAVGLPTWRRLAYSSKSSSTMSRTTFSSLEPSLKLTWNRMR